MYGILGTIFTTKNFLIRFQITFVENRALEGTEEGL